MENGGAHYLGPYNVVNFIGNFGRLQYNNGCNKSGRLFITIYLWENFSLVNPVLGLLWARIQTARGTGLQLYVKVFPGCEVVYLCTFGLNIIGSVFLYALYCGLFTTFLDLKYGTFGIMGASYAIAYNDNARVLGVNTNFIVGLDARPFIGTLGGKCVLRGLRASDQT